MRLDKTAKDEPDQENPEEMVRRAFSRCSNFPDDKFGVLGLAQGLKRASSRTGVPMERIVAECADTSVYCPTDADLLTVARGIRDASKRAVQRDPWEDWKREPSAPFDMHGYDHAQAAQRHRERDALWTAAKGLGMFRNGDWAPYGVICAALREAGYPKTPYQGEMLTAWEKC